MDKQIPYWKQSILILVLCGLSYGIWHQREAIAQLTGISLGKEPQAQQERRRGAGGEAVPVIVEAVTMTKAIDEVQSVGSGLAERSITLYPKVSGIVAEIDFQAGARVKAGDVILKLDDAQTRIAVSIVETRLADARRTLERNIALLPRNAVAQSTVDASRTAVETAEFELEQAREALADRTIRAPFDGVLGIPQIELGDRISETTAIATLDDRSRIIVEFETPEVYMKQVRMGLPIKAQSVSFPGQTFSGVISEIDSRVDTGTRSVRLRAALENPDDLLRGGMSFNVSLTLEGGVYPSIAELALLWEREGAYVWRVTQGTANRVPVSVVKRVPGRVLVDGALVEGQLVVVEGTQRLRPGRQVSFQEPVAETAGKAAL